MVSTEIEGWPYFGDVVMGNPGWKIMQFTGLFDKNGTEIYEGDRIKVWEHHVYDEGVVAFYKGSFIVGAYQCPVGEFQNIEVIGNIYDNPELLTNAR